MGVLQANGRSVWIATKLEEDDDRVGRTVVKDGEVVKGFKDT